MPLKLVNVSGAIPAPEGRQTAPRMLLEELDFCDLPVFEHLEFFFGKAVAFLALRNHIKKKVRALI